MKQYKYLFLISFLLFSIAAQGQRIKPSSRIEKAADSTYILLSDIDGKYQHTKLFAESGINFTISNDTIKIGATSTLDGSGQSLRLTSWLDANTLQATNLFYNGQEVRFSDLTNSITFPKGTTLERDVFPDDGQARYNTDNNEFEFYENGAWVTLGSGGGSGVTDITGGLGIDPDGSNTGSVTLSFDPTEFGTLSTLDGNEEMWGYSSIVGQPVKYDIQGVFSNVLNDQTNGLDFSENGTNQINIDFDFSEMGYTVTSSGEFSVAGETGGGLQRAAFFIDLLENTLTSTDASVGFTNNGTTLDLSASGGGGMTSWTARTEDLVTTTVSDGTILDFEAGNGLKTRTSLGDVKVILDGPSLIDLGSITGAYEMWVHSGVITGARSVQNILTDVLTSSDGSVTIGTSGNSVNLTATGSADGDANWDDASVSLSYTNGDMSSTVVSSTYANKRHFIIGSTLTSAAGGNNNIILPTASSTYQYHEIWVMSSDNSGSHNTIISSGSIIKTLADGELVCVKCVNLNGTYFWVAT